MIESASGQRDLRPGRQRTSVSDGEAEGCVHAGDACDGTVLVSGRSGRASGAHVQAINQGQGIEEHEDTDEAHILLASGRNERESSARTILNCVLNGTGGRSVGSRVSMSESCLETTGDSRSAFLSSTEAPDEDPRLMSDMVRVDEQGAMVRKSKRKRPRRVGRVGVGQLGLSPAGTRLGAANQCANQQAGRRQM